MTKIHNIIKNKSLPSFCTSNIDVLYSILLFCRVKKLPCLIECTSNQVNQYGGYTKKTPKMFIRDINSLRKKIKFNKDKLYLGGDHLGPLPWKNKLKKVALKNSRKLIEEFLKQKFCKIHIDTSIKCKDDKYIDSKVIFNRTEKILSDLNIQKKIKDKFIIIGTEVPLSGSGDTKKMSITSKSQIKDESEKFKQILKNISLDNKSFGLVIEPGMKYMHSNVVKPNFINFLEKKDISKKNNFVFEAHSTDYQSKKVLSLLVKNNFKFLKVGPELTYNYSKAIFYMQKIEEIFFRKKKSNFKEVILTTMLKNKKYWKEYYSKDNFKLLVRSKLDRMRYYLNEKKVKNSINILKENINKIKKDDIINLLNSKDKKLFNFYSKKRIKNFQILNTIFISKSISRYYEACGYRF